MTNIRLRVGIIAYILLELRHIFFTFDIMENNPTTLPTAGLIRRLAAMVYDSLLVFGVLFTATIPAVFFRSEKIAPIANEQIVTDLPSVAGGLPFQLYLLAVYVAFFCWFWKKHGQTLGMQAWRLQVVDISGSGLTMRQCIIRLFTALLSFLCFGAGYWWILIDKERLSWHDKLSHTRIVLLPKKN
jgi:uncharacterized RDD family membrane protein YckC